MSTKILPTSQPAKKPIHRRNGSDELDVFEAARYFSGATEAFNGAHKSSVSSESRNFGNTATQKYCMRPIGRMSLDMPSNRGNSIPLQAMLMDPMMPSSKEKKFKQPSSPGGKLAHFLNSLFNQTSSKKSKSKSTKDEDESSPGGWRRKRRSSISHFRSGSSTTTTSTITTTTTTATTTASAAITSDSKSPFSTSTSSGFRTPPPYHIAVAHTPTKTTSYKDPISYSDLKTPTSQITKIPINENLNKIETFNIKTDFSGRKMSFGNGFVEKVKNLDEKQDHERRRLSHKYVSRDDHIKEFKRFIDDDEDDEGNDSDSSSDLFELTNFDLGYYSSGLPVYETTHMDTIKRGAPISS